MEGVDLIDHLILLLRHRWLVIGITFSFAVAAVVISLLMTPIYRAETRILPPQQAGTGLSSALMNQLGSPSSLIAFSQGGVTSQDLYLGLLKSRTVLDRVIDRFDLKSRYGLEYREDVRSMILSNLKEGVNKKSGIIVIGYEDKDPGFAADMANAFVEELRRLNRELAVTEAGRRRLFFEEQLAEAKETLIASEDSLRGFQEKTGAVKMDEQTMALIDGMSQLRAKVAAKEVELKVMMTYATPQNPDIQRMKEEISGLREQLRMLEATGGKQDPDTILSAGIIPAIGTEFIRKMREFKFNEALYEILLKQYEAARLDEARDASIIQIIDQAVPPERRAKPKRRQIVVLSTLFGFILSVMATYLKAYLGSLSTDPEGMGKLDALKKYGRGFLRRTKP